MSYLKHIEPALVKLINAGRPAEALGLECGARFHWLDNDGWSWDDVREWLEIHRDIIEERPDQFCKHLGMNNFRTAVFILLHREGMLDSTCHSMERTIAWILDGSHHTVSVYHDDWVEIIDWNRVLTDEPGKNWLAAAPDVITAHRGFCGKDGRREGICWSVDRKTAERFAVGSQGVSHAEPRIVTARIHRADIAGALFGRESQVLVTDPDALDIIKEETI